MTESISVSPARSQDIRDRKGISCAPGYCATIRQIVLIGIIGDTHLGCTDYSRKRRADFSAAFCNAIQMCRDQGAEAICLLGDVFDSAATRRNVDAFAELLRDISGQLTELRRTNIPLIAIPGNHEYGRGREGGELAVLEHLGFAHVLRGTEIDLGQVRVCGIPWQNTPALIPDLVDKLRRTSGNGQRQILLVHNFITGGQYMPSEYCEIDPKDLQGFDQVFVGHHHVYEVVDHCTIPGSTETQNMIDKSEKCVLLYDSGTDAVSRHLLPKTHEVLIFRYDLTNLSPNGVVEALCRDLDSNQHRKEAFVYVEVRGTILANQVISKAELSAVLRERDLFDYCIELHYSTQSKSASESRRGASIEQILHRAFPGKELAKAKHYLAYDEDEKLFTDIRERILSDN
jgi:DNA repair exonuclease SbcCD nuclease subunit